MADYEGMRWFKCDLQMQTPADAKHWRGSPMGSSEAERIAAAEAFVRRCYDVGLEVVAITDHNFLSKEFIPLLEGAIHKFTGEFGYRLVIFPGFECEADVGKGVHVLGIFEPGSKLDELDHVLTACGVGYPRIQDGVLAKSTQRLPELIQQIQGIDATGKQRGLVVMPHATKNDGLFDGAKTSDWLQQMEFLNSELLAIEVPKPVEQMSAGWQRLLRGGEDCDPQWKRERPIACIMSSDNKALTEAEDANNYIGMRFTWIKMSKPSIEALRQAFLDPQSRIQLMGDRPSDALAHPRITKVEVKGAKFLDEQEVFFSESLNCVIGGRGSGKSSLLEYIRFALDHEDPASNADDEDNTLQNKRKSLKELLSPGSQVLVTFEVGNGVSDTLVYEPGRTDGPERWLDSREVADLKTVLRQLQVQFFSQGELSRMTSGTQGQAHVLSLIDAAAGRQLLELNAQERELQARLKALFQSTRDAARVDTQLREAKQEAVELERQLKAREAVQESSRQNQLASEARRYLTSMLEADEPVVQTMSQALSDLAALDDALPETASGWPNAVWFERTTSLAREARAKLTATIAQALQDYQQSMTGLLGEDAVSETLQAIEAVRARFREACAARGIREDDIARMQELEEKRQEKLRLVDERQKRLTDVRLEADQFPRVLSELHQVWKSQYDARSATAQGIQTTVASQTVHLTTSYMADEASFKAFWARLMPPDKRNKLPKRWDDIGEELFGLWRHRTDASVWETLEVARQDPTQLKTLLRDGLHQPLFAHLDSEEVCPIWEDVRISRVSDGIDVKLLREDGTVAGAMSGGLSEGQRNTVLLNMMLARGEGPIVIDQPEDELDSSFIYRTLVQDLRAAKSKRQLIIATHNANLPVNADAELIHALEARDGRGKSRAKGGLDRKDVAQAVLDIMEGSEQAFKRRSEKYHF